MTNGDIYCFSNPSMPGIVKIGEIHTVGKSVHDRAREIYGTGVPTPFTVEFSAKVTDSRGTEGIIHELLDQYRVNNSREFFRISPADAKRLIEQRLPDITWTGDEVTVSIKQSQSAYNRLSTLYSVVSKSVNTFIEDLRTHDYYDEGYSFTNEHTAKNLLQRLQTIRDGLDRMNEKEALESPYRSADNSYMKKELLSIQTDLDKFRGLVFAHSV